MWTPGFDPYAHIWCLFCWTGDSIQGRRVVNREEKFSVDDVESPDAGTDWVNEEVESVAYVCTHCGAEGTDVTDIATNSQNVAHEAYKKQAKKPAPIQEEYGYYDHYPEYEED